MALNSRGDGLLRYCSLTVVQLLVAVIVWCVAVLMW